MVKASGQGRGNIPLECGYIIQSAIDSGLISKAQQQKLLYSPSKSAWLSSEGLGLKPFFGTDSFDSPHMNERTLDDEFLLNKNEHQREKIKNLRTRMSLKGALGVTGVNVEELAKAREEDLAKRKSRKQELKNGTPLYF